MFSWAQFLLCQKPKVFDNSELHCLVPMMPLFKGMFPHRKNFSKQKIEKKIDGEKVFSLRR